MGTFSTCESLRNVAIPGFLSPLSILPNSDFVIPEAFAKSSIVIPLLILASRILAPGKLLSCGGSSLYGTLPGKYTGK